MNLVRCEECEGQQEGLLKVYVQQEKWIGKI